MSSLNQSELLAWGDLDVRRRRQSRGLLGLLTSSLAIALIASILLAADTFRRSQLNDPNLGPIGFALIVIAFAQVWVVFGTPYRMYWRSDSALLARLSIDGATLFQLASRRNLRAAGLGLVPAIAVSATVAVTVSPEVAGRLVVISVACATAAGLLATAACLAGGAIVASDKAQALIDSFGGEVQPPGVAWLGTLPGLVAVVIFLLIMTSTNWVALEEPLATTSLFASIGIAGVSVVLYLWARLRSRDLLLDAQREVAALDQERLAHIERSGPGPIERLWGAVTCRSPSSRLVFRKDASLLRRRYPAPYFVAFLGIVGVWILAATSQSGAAVVILCALAGYSLAMARRHAIQPVEQVRLIRTLPLERGSAVRAKRSASLLRSLMWCALPAVGVVTFASDPASALVIPSVAVVVAIVGGFALSGERGVSP